MELVESLAQPATVRPAEAPHVHGNAGARPMTRPNANQPEISTMARYGGEGVRKSRGWLEPALAVEEAERNTSRAGPGAALGKPANI